ncbi:hypothetical protein BS47DRAFT_49906 [Hydnum rufescens UP504]|uniref:Uncharacterized protein n=1 Tax=Hydnum rufescens UP504 TaxID=1448309 RepID=A0A9P6DUJ4_9AGAM|nr:hypothetical protein BS47DRAFT_49906 [Hydnum rufescens UP504]
MPNYSPWMGEELPLDPTAALPYLWSQLGTNPTVGLPGLNGSVMFSTLPSVMTGDVVFQDLYACDLSVRCGIIPRASGDSFQVFIHWARKYQFISSWSFTPLSHTNCICSIPRRWACNHAAPHSDLSMSSGAFAIGGNKESINAHPVFWFDDILLYLLSSDHGVANAFAYISMQNDSLKLDPLVSFAPPVQYTLQAQTWSFVNDDHKNAFLEDVNATFYIWPIGCSLFAQNITVDVQGDNTLLSKKTAHTPSDNPTPFLQA